MQVSWKGYHYLSKKIVTVQIQRLGEGKAEEMWFFCVVYFALLELQLPHFRLISGFLWSALHVYDWWTASTSGARDLLRVRTRKLCTLVVGHKRDSWYAIDSLTGAKVQTLSVHSASEVCPSKGINQLFIGRTGGSFYCC